MEPGPAGHPRYLLPLHLGAGDKRKRLDETGAKGPQGKSLGPHSVKQWARSLLPGLSQEVTRVFTWKLRFDTSYKSPHSHATPQATANRPAQTTPQTVPRRLPVGGTPLRDRDRVPSLTLPLPQCPGSPLSTDPAACCHSKPLHNPHSHTRDDSASSSSRAGHRALMK